VCGLDPRGKLGRLARAPYALLGALVATLERIQRFLPADKEPRDADERTALAVERLWIEAANTAGEYRRAAHVDPVLDPWADLYEYPIAEPPWSAGGPGAALETSLCGTPRCNPTVFWPSFRGRHQRTAQRPVERLPDDVGMPGMARGLLDEVEQDPPDGAGLWVGVPGLRRQRNTAGQVIDVADDRVGASAGLFILAEHCRESLALGKRKASHVVVEGPLVWRYSFDSVAPVTFSVAEMLDESSEAQAARCGFDASLLVTQAVCGIADGLPLMFQENEQALAFVLD
jgi:hypothetical protein